MRDSQKFKVYRSEGQLVHELRGAGELPTLGLDEARQMLADIWKLRAPLWDVDERVLPKVTLQPRMKGAWAGYAWRPAGGEIEVVSQELRFNPKNLNALILCHEATHALQVHRLVRGTIAAHGPEFTAEYRWLVERFMGFEVRQRLSAKMREHKVR